MELLFKNVVASKPVQINCINAVLCTYRCDEWELYPTLSKLLKTRLHAKVILETLKAGTVSCVSLDL